MSILRARRPPTQSARDEAEKPFWISFSDLMTALMVLFLVALTVALMSVTQSLSQVEDRKAEQVTDIERLLARLQREIAAFPGVTLRGSVIDFGERARFDTNSHRLTEPQARLLREFVPVVLALARAPEGEKWLKRIVVEGFADPRGSYLHNLDLSLRRSQRVLCALLLPATGPGALSPDDRAQVQALFRVSGASFNAPRASAEASRRIELRLEFRAVDEEKSIESELNHGLDNRCPLDTP